MGVAGVDRYVTCYSCNIFCFFNVLRLQIYHNNQSVKGANYLHPLTRQYCKCVFISTLNNDQSKIKTFYYWIVMSHHLKACCVRFSFYCCSALRLLFIWVCEWCVHRWWGSSKLIEKKDKNLSHNNFALIIYR